MSAAQNPDEFYAKLKAQLSDTSLWPAPYLFKFIIPASATKVEQIVSFFDNTGAVINTKDSRTGKYTSISINVKMKDPDAVIKKYKEVSVVEGVISL